MRTLDNTNIINSVKSFREDIQTINKIGRIPTTKIARILGVDRVTLYRFLYSDINKIGKTPKVLLSNRAKSIKALAEEIRIIESNGVKPKSAKDTEFLLLDSLSLKASKLKEMEQKEVLISN